MALGSKKRDYKTEHKMISKKVFADITLWTCPKCGRKNAPGFDNCPRCDTKNNPIK